MMGDPADCCYCHKMPPEVELRPYGPNGAWLCHPCMKANPEREAEAKRQFGQQCDGAGGIVIIGEPTGPRPFQRKPS